MRIRIEHETTYHYDEPVTQWVQELRLTPAETPTQRVIEWKLDAPGIGSAVSWFDSYGNLTHLANLKAPNQTYRIAVTGIVETAGKDGIIGFPKNSPPARLYVRQTPLTKPGKDITELAESLRGRHRDQIGLYHALMGEIADRMRFDTDKTCEATTAEQALSAGHGVCQDYSHIFIAVCRMLDQPARYVTGYLLLDDGPVVASAHHAWVEAEVAGLGWVAFDPVNCICADERYVRLANALDAASAAPVRATARGGAGALEVAVKVEEQPQQ